MHSNNSFIPSLVNAETHLYVALIDLVYSSASFLGTFSFKYKSFLFPTINTLTLFISRLSLTSLYNFFKALKLSRFVISYTNIIA